MARVWRRVSWALDIYRELLPLPKATVPGGCRELCSFLPAPGLPAVDGVGVHRLDAADGAGGVHDPCQIRRMGRRAAASEKGEGVRWPQAEGSRRQIILEDAGELTTPSAKVSPSKAAKALASDDAGADKKLTKRIVEVAAEAEERAKQRFQQGVPRTRSERNAALSEALDVYKSLLKDHRFSSRSIAVLAHRIATVAAAAEAEEWVAAQDDVMQPLMQKLINLADGVSAGGFGDVLWALGKLGLQATDTTLPIGDVVNALLKKGTARVRELDAGHIAIVAWSLGRLRVSNIQDFVDAMSSRAIRKMMTFSPKDLGIALEGLGQLGCTDKLTLCVTASNAIDSWPVDQDVDAHACKSIICGFAAVGSPVSPQLITTLAQKFAADLPAVTAGATGAGV
ncbi:unnamed protein product [Ostreobium quekettii]|uniref:Uncharacterized protein n=1 Tax=Ostreobium quekettii TaxID=121088 RepID=A0A8S1IN48_9CHLO|nr:unnamed protein product [Ostreobium quekettii]